MTNHNMIIHDKPEHSGLGSLEVPDHDGGIHGRRGQLLTIGTEVHTRDRVLVPFVMLGHRGVAAVINLVSVRENHAAYTFCMILSSFV